MSWIDESWQQAARDYHAGRKHGRRQGNSHMDFEREKLAAEIIPLGKHREQPEEIRPPAFSDDALALHFIDEHKDTLRYVPSLGKWLRWDGKRWCFDERLIAHDRMRKVCRAAAAECNQLKVAKLIASNKTAAAAERFARSDQRIIATVDELDAESMAAQYAGQHHRSANRKRMATSTGRPAHQDHGHCARCIVPDTGLGCVSRTQHR